MDNHEAADPNWDEAYERGFADRLYADTGDDPAPKAQRPARRRRRHRLLRVLLVLAVLLLAAWALHSLLLRQPAGASDSRKPGTSTILLAGTDASGDRTDTIMLLNINRSERRMSLLSIPRDTWVNSTYTPHKINIAYGVNGKGESGMASLMDYVADCVGFRPDAYLLVELDAFVELVDLFGGVEFEVPCAMDYEDPSQGLSIHLQVGAQRLDGYAAMGLVRFRSGYAMADLERVRVQRDFMQAAVQQWARPANLLKLPDAVELLLNHATTDLSRQNLLWLAESAALCTQSQMLTIPYTLDAAYVYVDISDAYLDTINTFFNPYERAVTRDDLVQP